MRRLAFFCGGVSLGIAAGQCFSWGVGGCLWAAVAIVAGAMCAKALGRRRLALCLLGVCLGLGRNAWYLRQVALPMEALADTEQTLTMTLLDYPVQARFGAQVPVRAEGMPGRLMYYGDDTLLPLVPGQRLRGTVRLQSAGRIRDTDVTVFTSKGIFLLAYGQKDVRALAEEGASLRWWPRQMAAAVQGRLAQMFSGDALGLVTALLTGQRQGLSVQADTDLSESGIYHVLAVSGMHCAFLLGLVQTLAGRHRRRLSAAAGITVLVFYALFTGASPSVVRSCVMLSMMTAAPLFGRKNDPPTAMAAALGSILLKNPYAVYSVSLQLSFAAVAGLIFISPRLYRGLAALGPAGGKVGKALRGSLAVTAACLFTTAPITAWYFGRLIPVSFLANFLCLWAVAAVYTGTIAAVAVSVVSLSVGRLVAAGATLCIRYILAVCQALASLPFHGIYFLTPWLTGWLVLVYALIAAAWCLPGDRRRHALTALALSALTLSPALWAGRRSFGHRLDAAVVDVGQGQSILLKSGSAAAVVDCGSANGWYDPGTHVSDLLWTMGCGRLQTLVLTHLDADHISGVERLMARMPVETLLMPETARGTRAADALRRLAQNRGVQVHLLSRETTVSLGEAALRIFPAAEGKTSNQRGLAILASVDESDLLITGDLDRRGEEGLLAAYDLPDIEVFVAGHHGAKDATSETLLAALDPESVIISVGANSYGHPAEETMQRLGRAGCTVYRTDRHGTVYIAFE